MAGDDNNDRKLHPEPWPADVGDAVPGADLPQTWENWKAPSSDPRPQPRPVDAEAARAVRLSIMNDVRAPAGDFHVTIHGERLRLEGKVHSEADRRQIVQKAEAIVGRAAVEDALLVDAQS